MSVTDILARTRRTAVIDGCAYVYRKPDALMWAESIGQGVVAMLEATAGDVKQAEVNLRKYRDNMQRAERLCRLALVSPRIGDVTDPEADVIAWADLGEHREPLFAEITREDSEQAQNFPEQSTEQTG